MTAQEKDRIECAIRHIQTAVDVDPWAKEIAVDAMEKNLNPTCTGSEELKQKVKNSTESSSTHKALPSAQPQYTELTPEEAASEIASGSIMSASYWLDAMIRLKQMGYAICRKENRWEELMM